MGIVWKKSGGRRGHTPSIRLAWPMLSGRTSLRRILSSVDNPTTLSRAVVSKEE